MKKILLKRDPSGKLRINICKAFFASSMFFPDIEPLVIYVYSKEGFLPSVNKKNHVT